MLALGASQATAHASIPAGNLIANPGAEASAGATDASAVAAPTGWTTSPSFTAVQYGSPGFPTTAQSTQLGGGVNFFAGGPDSGRSTATKSIDLTTDTDEIDAGNAKATLTALLGGFATQGDSATVRARMRGSDGQTLASITVGSVTSSDRGGVTSLISRSATGAVPPGTRTIVVTITATRVEGSYNDGYVDNVSLTLARSVGGGGGPDCVVATTLSDGSRMPYCRNLVISDRQPQVTRAVVVVHGKNRNVDDYYHRMVQAASGAGAGTATAIVAPYFQKHSGAPDGQLAWRDWQWGERSTGDGGLPKHSSFEIVDRFVAQLANKTNFPNLTEIVIAGHSAGGQFTQRYAAFNKAEPKLRGVGMRYVVANPSSYVYLNGRRWIKGKFRGLDEARRLACPGWNTYGYGLRNRRRYVAEHSARQVRRDYAAREVVYLLGEADTKRGGDLDATCSADYQGRNRLRRGRIFLNFMNSYFAGHAHDLVTVPNVGHKAGEMFDSPNGRAVLFPSTG